MNGSDDICRLCLRVPNNGFVLIDHTVRQMLDGLPVEMNLDVSNEPLMCEECAETIKSSFSFKTMCVESEEKILSFDTAEDETNVDLRGPYAHNSKEPENVISDVCRICIKKVREGDFISLDALMKDNTFSDMMREYMSKMDSNIIRNPVLCLHCRDDMKSYFEFLRNCRDTEEKINAYRQSGGIKTCDKIILKNVSDQLLKDTKKKKKYIIVIVKKEDKHKPKAEIKEEIATEDDFNTSFTHQSGEMNAPIPCTCDTKDSSCFGCCGGAKEAPPDTVDIKVETAPSEMDNDELKIEAEELDIKDEVTVSESACRQGNVYEFNMCMCKTKMEKCAKCSSQFELVSTRPTVYKCKLCPYQGNRIHPHMLKHRDISEVQKVYRCDSCDFQTKYNRSLRYHFLLTHKKNSDVAIFRCVFCKFQSRSRKILKRHLYSHSIVGEISMYKCTTCDFKTTHKGSFTRHLSVHGKTPEDKMYECKSCEYKTNYIACLQEHMFVHKDPSEVETVKCHLCDSRFISMRRLGRHMRRHAKTTIYKCEHCMYETRFKQALSKHGLRHKSPSEVEMYRCEMCDFQTKYKRYVKTHMLLHKDPWTVKIYQCDACAYKAYNPHRLKKHMIVHKSLSEVQPYKCTEEGCKFLTKHKYYLKRHLLTHSTVYKCALCEFETRGKASFNRHNLLHARNSGKRLRESVVTK